MKQLALCVLASVMIIFLAVRCKNNSGNVTLGNNKSDTTLCVGIYKNLLDSTVRFGEMRRITNMVTAYMDVDSTTKKKQTVHDTSFLIIIPTPVRDSEMVKQYGIPMFDSLHRRNTVPLFYIYNKKFVRNGWENADSAIAELQRTKL